MEINRVLSQSWANLPTDRNLNTFTAEQQLTTTHSIIKSLVAQKEFVIDSSTLKLKVGTYRKIVKLCNLKSFHSEIDGKESAYNCFTLALPLLANAYNSRNINENSKYHIVVKSIISNFKNWFTSHRLLSFFLPHISGFHKNKLEENPTYQFLARFLTLIESTAGRWTSVNEAMDCMLIHRENKQYTTSLITIYEFNNMDISNKLTNEIIMPDDFVEQLGIPFLKSICCAFAGLGIIEVAYRPYNSKDDLSPFDFIEYFRLTRLGLYAFGISHEYNLPTEKNIEYFAIEDNHLIARSIANPNPYEQVLASMSQHIGGGRYKFSYESFLAGCATPEDVVRNIEQFKNFICEDMPQIWKDFFAEVKNRVNPLKKENISAYKMFTIDSSNKYLINILTTDPELRKMIIRAEGFHILVREADVKKFSNKLKTYGYLL